MNEAIITNTERDLPAISQSLVLSLSESLKRNPGNGLLLSGGLDTSILASLASGWYKPECITVALAGAPAPDIEYARQVADLFCLKHDVRFLGEEEMVEGIQATIAILKSFDPMEIRNSSAIYLALKIAREKGLKQVLTGDGSEQLFL
jgi:asparagine synthase (glutamine-hydrolysing)